MAGKFCDSCRVPFVKGVCPDCGDRAEQPASGVEGYHLSKRNPLRSVQCAYRTGTWQCRWGKLTREKHAAIYCDFHREVLRHEVSRSVDVFELFKKEREFHTKTYVEQSIAVMNEDLSQSKDTPFWFQPMAEQWHVLSGLPLPVSALEPVNG